jgi:hypothetical protein
VAQGLQSAPVLKEVRAALLVPAGAIESTLAALKFYHLDVTVQVIAPPPGYYHARTALYDLSCCWRGPL